MPPRIFGNRYQKPPNNSTRSTKSGATGVYYFPGVWTQAYLPRHRQCHTYCSKTVDPCRFDVHLTVPDHQRIAIDVSMLASVFPAVKRANVSSRGGTDLPTDLCLVDLRYAVYAQRVIETAGNPLSGITERPVQVDGKFVVRVLWLEFAAEANSTRISAGRGSSGPVSWAQNLNLATPPLVWCRLCFFSLLGRIEGTNDQ
jgi:hypothetical protein